MDTLSLPVFCTDAADRIIGGNAAFASLFPSSVAPELSLRQVMGQFEELFGFLPFQPEDLQLLPCGGEEPVFFCEKMPKAVHKIWVMTKESEGFYLKILENLHDAVHVCDKNGIVLYVNRAFEKYHGVKREQLLGHYSVNFMGNGGCSESPLPQVIQTKRPVTMDQLTYAKRKITITATPILDSHNEIDLIVEDIRDITEIEFLRETISELSSQNAQYKSSVGRLEPQGDIHIISQSKSMERILNTLRRVSPVDSTVLLLGESGTGKTHIAKYIHANSKRKDAPFVTINCSTIPESLFESELFGYLPGTFTGASKGGKIGLVELANGGTLFLDEIGELPPHIQAKMLQLIQEQTFLPVGGTKEKRVDVRIISATNKDLAKLVSEGSFREDLYYRLRVVEIHLPPLRERREDIFLLLHYYLNLYDKKYNFSHSFDSQTLEILTQYHWPGNIRELSNIIESLVVVVADPVILPEHLPPYMYSKNAYQYNISIDGISSLDEELEKLERAIITKAYQKQGTSYKVAKALGISQSQAVRKIRKYCQDQ